MSCCDWTGKTIFQSAGGRVVPAGNPVFENITALAAFRVEVSQNGLMAWVLSVQDAFVYQNDSDLTEDGITVVLPPASSIGRWVRLQIPNERWARQATWYIDNAGDDENNGRTSDEPLRTHAELERRVHGLTLRQATVVTIQSSLPEALRLDVWLADGVSSTGTLTYEGVPRLPLLRAENAMSDVAPINVRGAAGVPPNSAFAFTDEDPLLDSWETGAADGGSLIGHRVRIVVAADTSRVGAVAWLARQDPDADPAQAAPTRVRTSPFVQGAALVTPQDGDRYVVEDLWQVHGFDLMLRRRGRGEPVCVIRNLRLTRSEGGAFNSRFKSDNGEARYVLVGCRVTAVDLEMDRGNFEGCLFEAPDDLNLVIHGQSVHISAGLTLNRGFVVDSPSGIFFDVDHLVQGDNTLGMVVRAPAVELNGIAFFDCNPALVVHHGGAVRVGFESHAGDIGLWGANNGAAPIDDGPPGAAVVIEPGALLVYDSPGDGQTLGSEPLIEAVEGSLRYVVGGFAVGRAAVTTDQRAPFFNNGALFGAGNGAGLVNRNGNGVRTSG